MAEKVVTSKKNYYFCTVKTYERHEVAAEKQRFLCPYLVLNIQRKEWGSSNAPKVTAREYLTAPTALSLYNV